MGINCNEIRCNLNGRENDERTQVDTNTNKIIPGLNERCMNKTNSIKFDDIPLWSDKHKVA